MRRYSIFLLALSLLLLLLGSCRQSAPLAPEEPIVTLLAPSNASTVPRGDVQVRVYLQNFKLAEASGANRAGQGHIIYYLDAPPPLGIETPATTAFGSFAESTDTSYVWRNVPPGPHTFYVQLVNNDGSPLLPPVAVRATVTVK